MSEEAPSLDLSALDFRPAWAKEPSSAPPAPRETREENRGPRHDRGETRPPRPGGFKRGGPPRKGGFRGPKDRPNFDGPRRDERPAPPPNPFPWLRIAFTATPPAVETVVRQVRQTGKTYSLFDIARILLRNPASYTLDLTSAPKQEEGPFHVTEGTSVWLSRENAVRHILRTRLEDFYRAETVDVEAPKGNFTSIGVCGMSGTLLGPTNLHDFERRLRELHRERFSRMDFETFRSRIRMERDPEAIEKWRAAASKATHYFPKEGENPEKMESLAAVEQHFLENHAAAEVRLEQTAKVPGDPKNARVDAALAPLLNYAKDEEARFPLRLAQSLSRALSEAGLRFHKSANKTTFVSMARPRHLNLEEITVSDSIKKIIELVRAKKSIRRHELLDQLAPLPKKEPASSEAPPSTSTTSPQAPAPTLNTASSSDVPEPVADSTTPDSVTPPESSPAPEADIPIAIIPLKSPEEAARDAVVQDLLWLTHEGYLIEFADSRLESVPPPKNPPKPPAEVQPEPQVASVEVPVSPPADSSVA
ncbi:MAG: hypothetical protein RIQ71_301 [Verrucomicrobiota bacterium]|jgi:hypothetical protein